MKRAAIYSAILSALLANNAIAQHSHQNLVQNSGAESGVLIGHSVAYPQYGIYSIPGWTQLVGQIEGNAYADGTSPALTPTSPGAPDRGSFYFFGGLPVGTNPHDTADQVIDLGTFAPEIATGSATYSLSAWLGGFNLQPDYATVTVNFENPSNVSLGTQSIGPVTPAQRNNITEMLHQGTVGIVPVGATKAVVTLDAITIDYPSNNGIADNISLAVSFPSAITPGDFNFDGSLDMSDVAAMQTAIANPAMFEADHGLSAGDFNILADFNGDGKANGADIQALLIDLKSGLEEFPVPEPSTLALLALGSLVLLARRRFTTAA